MMIYYLIVIGNKKSQQFQCTLGIFTTTKNRDFFAKKMKPRNVPSIEAFQHNAVQISLVSNDGITIWNCIEI